MGGFYGSVQIRTSDRQRLKGLLLKFLATHKQKALLGPVLGDWLGIYPQNGGQDQSLGAFLAQQTGLDVLHLLVHDDDVTAYFLYGKGQLVDSYRSRPGYFSESQRAQQESSGGDPQQLERLVPGCGVKVAKLLSRHYQPSLEVERLQALARALKISNAATSYEYLLAGERDGIKSWRGFEELPPADLSEALQAKQRRKELKVQLKKSGQLLFEQHFKHQVRVCPVDDGFLVSRSSFQGSLEWHRPPYKKPVQLPWVQGFTNCLEWGPTGTALCTGGRFELRQHPSGQLITRLNGPDAAVVCRLSRDGHRMALAGQQSLQLLDLPQGTQLACWPRPAATPLALHPDGQTIAFGRHSLGLINAQGECKQLFVGGLAQEHPLVGLMQTQVHQTFQNLDLDEVKSQVIRSLKGIKANPEDLERIVIETLSQFETARQGPPEFPKRSQWRILMLKFSLDGRWLFVGSEAGLHVCDWSQLVAAPADSSLTSRWHFAPAQNRRQGAWESFRCIYAAAQEADGGALWFGGRGGQLHRMDLQQGGVTGLPPLIDDGCILQLGIQGQHLATVSQSSDPSGSGGGSWLRIWNLKFLGE